MKKTIAILLHDDPSGVERAWAGDTEEEVIRKVFDYVARTFKESGDLEELEWSKEYRSKAPILVNWEYLQSWWTGDNDTYLFHLFTLEV